jgi:hypothetical protein
LMHGSCKFNKFYQIHENKCWYFLTFTEMNPQAYGITVVAFTRWYLGYHILLANLSKDNTRVELEKGRDGFLWLLGLRIAKPYFHLFTSGTGLYLVYQVPLANRYTPSPYVGEC